MLFFAITDKGKVRESNQDYVFASDTGTGFLDNLFIVADGMGGHLAGEFASEQAVHIVLDEIRKKEKKEPVPILESAISTANRRIYEMAHEDPSKAGMGTTIVAATFYDGHLYVANVGDSRLYVMHQGRLSQITKDHSVVQELLNRGGLTPDSDIARRDKHIITRAVGAEEEVRVDIFDVAFEDVDQVLLCTDGLSNMLDDDEICDILASDDKVRQKAGRLMDRALEKGGKDNITVLLIDAREDM